MADGLDLGPLESEVLRTVWEKGEADVDEVHRRLQDSREIAYTTVMTVMARLAAKGILHRRKEGRAYVYSAAVDRSQVAGSSLRDWAQRFFGGKVMPAVSFLLGNEKLSSQDVAELKRLVEELDRQGKGES